MDLIGNNDFDLLVADDVTGISLLAPTVHLFQNDTQVDRNTVIGDLTEATYTGYASEAVTWLAPSVADDGAIEVVGTVGEFRPTGSAVVNDIYGIMVKSGIVGTPMVFCARFDDAPLPMASALNAIVVTLRWRPQTNGLVVTVS
jgi:hypothetical protein